MYQKNIKKDDAFLTKGLGEKLHGVSSVRIIQARIPPDFRVIKFEKELLHDNVLSQFAEVNDYLANLEEAYDKGTGLYLFGNGKGTGKTSLMCHALIQTLRYTKPCYTAMFSTYQDYLDIARKKFDNEEELEPYYAVDFLGLDEVYHGGLKTDVEAINLITRLIKDRSNNRTPTFITSNYTPAEFRKTYGERADSILDGSKYRKIEFTGEEDIRKVYQDLESEPVEAPMLEE
jgi:DNA replication protein DnaC